MRRASAGACQRCRVAAPSARREFSAAAIACALLQGGDELFPAMREAIAGHATRYGSSTYIFHDDDAAREMAAALPRPARRGVRVRVVVDGFGSEGHARARCASGCRRLTSS